MKLTRPLDSGLTLVAEVCNECGDLGPQLLERIAPAADRVQVSGTATVALDWATLRLRATNGEVRVGEPEYRSDPAHFTDSMVRTSRVLLIQHKLMRSLGVEAQPVSATQRVRISSDALSATSIVGRRERETDPIATGWQFIAASEEGNQEFGLYTVRQVAEQHPHWCAALALPAGWTFRYVGRTLIDCVSPSGETHKVMLSVEV